MVNDLNLMKEYAEYNRDTSGICDGLRSKIPTLVGSTYLINGKKDTVKEAMLFKWFGQVYKHMTGVKHKYLDNQPNHNYVFKKHETKPVTGTLSKPDGVVYYGSYLKKDFGSVHMIIEAKVKEYANGPSGEALGQMADYAQLVWQNQPTRVFVPVLFLHNFYVDLVVFARCGYRYTRLGSYISNTDDDEDIDPDVLETIRRIWFFLIQPPEKFGHFVCVSTGSKFLRFEGDTNNTTVRFSEEASNDRVDIVGRFEGEIPISRRTAYLLTVKYRGRKAVLKLAWTPVERQPEGALYDILKREKIDCIPEIYRSGVVVNDFLGYRLEYIIMEHCGEPLNTFFAKYGQNATKEDFLYSCASNVIRNVCACLLQAARAGVHHRDVSAGNITIHDGKVFLIDWGFGKVALTTLNGRTKELVNSAWNIDLDKITQYEDARDGVTGTVLFMGIRVLMGLSGRSVFDDFESVLYVVLVSLSHIGSSKPATELSEMGKVCHRNQAIWKYGCMTDSDDYPTYFGVFRCSKSLRQLLDALHKMLFLQNDVLIGGKLLKCKVDERKDYKEDLIQILGEDLYGVCYPDSTLDASDAEGSSVSLKRKSESTGTTGADSNKEFKVSKKQGSQENVDPNVYNS
ncbi:hypothetical protein LPJ53_004952 [Coemansia erecta]|uniref:Protein kinase domain-containing protein n=1 Tax=Coemansia erecta TaxID=147472 RepID=A0A9W7XW39_9FUNG|nr:hypothetical protein LPJ53_004952 [Coemansia erecta]